MKKFLPIILASIFFTPFIVLAVNITVPSAPSSGYGLTSTTTGAYVFVPSSGVAGNCVQWAANNGFADALLPCGTGSGGGVATTSLLASYPIKATKTSASITYSLLDMATSTLSGTGGISVSNSPFIIGGLGAVISCSTCTLNGVTAVTGTWPILSSGGTTPNITWGGLATTSQPASSNVLVSDGGKGIYGAATSTLTPTSPLTGSFTHIGTTGSIGIQAASASQAGSMAAVDYSRLYTATSTFSAPLVYTLSTNAVTCPTCNTSGATVSSIATNNGITGGTITTTGTLSLDQTFGAVWTAASSTYTGHLSLNTSSSTQFSSNTIWTGLGTAAGTFLAVDPNGKIIATTTPSGGSGTVTSVATTYPVTGGTFTTSGTIALAFGTTTANTWTPLQTFGTTAANTRTILANGPVLINSGSSAAAYQDLNIGGVGGWATNESHSINFVFDSALGTANKVNSIQAAYDGTFTYLNFRDFNNGGDQTSVLMGIRGDGNVSIATTTYGTLFNLGGVANFSTATSTFYSTGGLNLTKGCFAINGTCLSSSSGTVTSIATNNGLTGGTITTTGTIGLAAISANSVLGNITGASAVPVAVATSSLFNTAASGVTGLLSGTDWTTFNNKVATSRAINTTYPVTGGGDLSADRTLALAFGTTTSNTWANTQTFTNPIVVGAGTSTFGALQGTYLNLTGSTASSTASNGFNISAGCFAISGTCVTGTSSNSPFSPAANYATTGALPSNTYNNGASGVGATITEVGTGALSVDGASPAVGQRVLVKNEATAANNGLYGVTVAGSGIAAFVLTRDIAYDTNSEIIPGVITYIISGSTLADDFWAMTSAAPITVGTTALNYMEVSGGGANVVSVSNSDGTLTISPTAGAVVASLALAHANTWTGLQIFNNATSTLFSCTTCWAGTLNLTNALGIASGGTNATSFTQSGGILAYDGTREVNFSGYTLTSSLLTAANASTTNLTAGSSNYAVNPLNMLPIYIASSTWGTGTTTITMLNNVRGFTLVDAICSTDAGTLFVDIYHAQNHLNFFQASSTHGTITFSSNNVVTAGTTTMMDVGTAASSPTKFNCTPEYTYNSSS